MDYSVIDELYDIYMNENLDYAKEQFYNYLENYKYRKKQNIKDIIHEYIQEQTKNFSNFYESNKDENKNVQNIIKNITLAFEYFVEPIHSFILSNIYKEIDLEETKFDNSIVHRELTPNDLFNINIDLMEEAIKDEKSFDIEDFTSVKNLIQYVKESKLLETLYSDGSWREMNFGELIESLYDKTTNKSIFETSFGSFYDYEETLFGKVKENCSKISSIEFDKSRAKLITTKQITVNYGKLIFCRNLLMFYNTGIMPTNDGLLDCSIDYYEFLNLVDELKTSKMVCFDNRILIGHLVMGNCDFICASNYEIPYLIHIDIKDVNNGGRVRVRIRPSDNIVTNDSDIPFAYPLLPKMLHVKPKLHEMVFIILMDDKNKDSQRYYIGPVISQPQFIEKQLYGAGASNLLQGSPQIPSPSNEYETKGLLPSDETVAISSRKNTDILLKDNDILIRCGVKLLNDSKIEFNQKNPAFIKLKYYPYGFTTNINNKTETINSVATIHADKINLISSNGEPYVGITDKEHLLNEKAIENFLKNGHEVPYGDKLCELLSAFIKVFREHTHNYNNLPPVHDPNYTQFVAKYGIDGKFLKELLLSKNIKIN